MKEICVKLQVKVVVTLDVYGGEMKRCVIWWLLYEQCAWMRFLQVEVVLWRFKVELNGIYGLEQVMYGGFV